jgi:phosphoribosylanthranilate isomerase
VKRSVANDQRRTTNDRFMTWIKICGTTNLEDAVMSVEAGADALGFVFYKNSPRNVTPEVVREIVAKLPVKIEKVGVFVNQSFEFMESVAARTGLTGVQLHADLSGDNNTVGAPSNARIKKYLVISAEQFFDSQGKFDSFAVSVRNQESEKWINALFLDSGTSQQPGGTGIAFDWLKSAPIAETIRRSGFDLVVAGGLNSGNVAEAIRILNPWGVDVVSGVEASPGKKDPEKVRAFISSVRQADKKK